jgi:glycosyltransferase involved in cell wall biosynthesis
LQILLIIFSVAVFAQLIYLIVFLAAFNKKQQHHERTSPAVSIVVCAHDEEANLRELIPILLQQNYASFEVIIVNDRSNDNTYDYLLELTNSNPQVKMVNVKSVPENMNSKKYALTLGIRAAVNDWILFTDADCRPVSNRWLAEMSTGFSATNQFVLGFSPYQPAPGFLNAFIRFESFITGLQYLSFGLLKKPYMGVGRNMAYRKSLFLEKKGFNHFLHVLGGDDDLFVNQHANGKNTSVVVTPDAIVYSIPERTFTGFFYQKLRHLSVGKRYRAGDKFNLGIFKISWILTLFIGLALCVVFPMFYVIIAVLLVRLSLLTWAIHRLVKSGGLTFNYWWIPVLDLLYPIYYLSTGLVALFTKKVRWKK